MITEAVDAILRAQCTPAVVRAIEAGGSTAALWEAVETAGFLELLRPEAEGGGGIALSELYPVFGLLGRHAVPLPVGQSICARALVRADARLPRGLVTLAPALLRELDGSWRCPLVPYGTVADQVLAADEGGVVLLACAEARLEPTGIRHSQVATLIWPATVRADRVGDDGPGLVAFAAALHAALLAGAMARVFEMTLDHCNHRSQFGKTLGQFQAVQHQLAVMAEQVAAAGMAAEAAFQGDAPVPRTLAAAVAKARASEAAVAVANTAHALHGAIGITEEYDLQLHTRRLHEWRAAHGAESHWNRLIGERLLAFDGTVAEFVRA